MDNPLVFNALEPDYMRLLARSILGTDDPGEVNALALSLVSESLDLSDPGCFHFELSVGATFGFESRDAQYLLKVLSPDQTLEDAIARTGFQAFLRQHQFPCPDILAGPTKRGNLVYVVEEYARPGRMADGHNPSDRVLMAGSLANLVSLSGDYSHEYYPTDTLIRQPSSLWPKPHNALFDFEATTSGAAWIDEIAASCMDAIQEDDTGPVIGHMDWSAKHIRVEDGDLAMVYDWDSTALVPETQVLASAAASFTYQDPHTTKPDLEDAARFIRDYEQARGVRLPRNLLAAHLTYGAAYTARCEHAIDTGSKSAHSARDFLRRIAETDLRSAL